MRKKAKTQRKPIFKRQSNDTVRRGTTITRRKPSFGLSLLLAHQRACKESVARLIGTPLGTLMTVLVIAVALSLPSSFLLLLKNGKNMVSGWDGERVISVFLELKTELVEITRLQTTLEQLPEIQTVDYVSPGDALTEFGRDAGFSDALALLEENPLPPVLVVKLHPDADRLEQVRQLQKTIQGMPAVDRVDVDMEWIERFEMLLETVHRAALALAYLIALGVLLVIGNTIRLDILNQRTEIVIIKRVGGTQAFIRRPFLYTGLIYGGAGSLLAWILIEIGLGFVRGPVSRLATSFQSDFTVHGLGLQGGITLLMVGLLLGLVGSWLAVTRHLRMIEPT